MTRLLCHPMNHVSTRQSTCGIYGRTKGPIIPLSAGARSGWKVFAAIHDSKHYLIDVVTTVEIIKAHVFAE
jgi:hypothetical protein